MTVTLDGVSADPCPNCELLNADFILEFSLACTWLGPFVEVCPPSGVPEFRWFAGPESLNVAKVGAIWRIDVLVAIYHGPNLIGTATYRKEYDSVPDCFSFDDEELSLFSTSGSEICDWPTTCLVTSI